MRHPAPKPAICRLDLPEPLLPSATFTVRDSERLIFVKSCAQRVKFLRSLLAVLALAGLAGYLARSRKNRTSPLVRAQAAHARWIARPDDVGASRNYCRCVARLVEWFESLSPARRPEACREEGLDVEMDPTDETGLRRFTVAHKVPAHRAGLIPCGVLKAPLAWPTRTPITTPIPARRCIRSTT